MAGLAQAVGDLFARIAAALAGAGRFPGSVGSVNTGIPHPPPSPVPSPGPGTPPAGPPGTGTPSPPIDRVVDVPTTNLFPTPPPADAPVECPLFSPSQYLQFVDLQTRAQDAGVTLTLPAIAQQGSTQDMSGISAIGIPVEADDIFRFRAFGSAGAQTVSFFGRVAGPTGQITPFNHSVIIDGTGTVFQTTPRPGPGFLLDSAASVPIGAITTGAVNAVGEIGRMVSGAFVPHTLLFAGQISDQLPLSTSLASPSAPTNNPTFKEVLAAATGTDTQTMTINVTPGKQARITAIFFLMTCSASAGNRILNTKVECNGTFLYRMHASVVLTASQKSNFYAQIGGQSNSTIVALAGYFNIINVPLPESLYMTGTVVITCGENTFGLGDVCSGASVDYEET